MLPYPALEERLRTVERVKFLALPVIGKNPVYTAKAKRSRLRQKIPLYHDPCFVYSARKVIRRDL